MKDRRKPDTVPNNSQFFTFNEQNFCSTYHELIGIVLSLTIYEHKVLTSDQLFFCFE